MNQVFEELDLNGKTIERTGYINNRFVLFFSDNTYAVFRGCGWYDNGIELMDEKYSLVPNKRNLRDLNEIGVISKEEYFRLRDIIKKEDAKTKMEEELKELERLRRKYNK